MPEVTQGSFWQDLAGFNEQLATSAHNGVAVINGDMRLLLFPHRHIESTREVFGERGHVITVPEGVQAIAVNGEAEFTRYTFLSRPINNLTINGRLVIDEKSQVLTDVGHVKVTGGLRIECDGLEKLPSDLLDKFEVEGRVVIGSDRKKNYASIEEAKAALQANNKDITARKFKETGEEIKKLVGEELTVDDNITVEYRAPGRASAGPNGTTYSAEIEVFFPENYPLLPKEGSLQPTVEQAEQLTAKLREKYPSARINFFQNNSGYNSPEYWADMVGAKHNQLAQLNQALEKSKKQAIVPEQKEKPTTVAESPQPLPEVEPPSSPAENDGLAKLKASSNRAIAMDALGKTVRSVPNQAAGVLGAMAIAHEVEMDARKGDYTEASAKTLGTAAGVACFSGAAVEALPLLAIPVAGEVAYGATVLGSAASCAWAASEVVKNGAALAKQNVSGGEESHATAHEAMSQQVPPKRQNDRSQEKLEVAQRGKGY